MSSVPTRLKSVIQDNFTRELISVVLKYKEVSEEVSEKVSEEVSKAA